jgi:hypothetical protein
MCIIDIVLHATEYVCYFVRQLCNCHVCMHVRGTRTLQSLLADVLVSQTHWQIGQMLCVDTLPCVVQ